MSAHVFDLEPEFLLAHEQCAASTMTSLERMYALWQATEYIEKAGITGDIVECGVWRGGSMMLVAKQLMLRASSGRTLWLYDTYTGMTEPGAEDVQAMTGEQAGSILAAQQKDNDNPFWAIAQRDLVEQNMRSTGYPETHLRYVEGPVEQTIPAQAPDGVALLRLDTDWYESTRHELEHLWPRLAVGGVLIVDDYGYWEGARRAVDEFFDTLPNRPFLSRIDYTGRIAIKR